MWGSETLTMELSSTSSVVPSITASATSHLCDPACAVSISGMGAVVATAMTAMPTRRYHGHRREVMDARRYRGQAR